MPEWRPGSLVKARERDWLVLPQDEPDVIRLRPIDGSDADEIGIHRQLEPDALHEATYPVPDPSRALGSAPGRLLHDAARLRLRSGAGPFRSMGRLSVSPRPYQLVPLIMALRLDPVRLLIADDVGVGKTIEAALIARELLDRGVIQRIGVLCPPHLCDQWVHELGTKFNIEAALVQPSRMARLERGLPRPDLNVFRYYRHIVASIDYMKSERYRDTFLQNAPELIIVDEAHSAARPRSDRGGAQQQRHELLRRLAEDRNRHIILATATPHSGIEESFRSLLGLLDPDLDCPEAETAAAGSRGAPLRAAEAFRSSTLAGPRDPFSRARVHGASLHDDTGVRSPLRGCAGVLPGACIHRPRDAPPAAACSLLGGYGDSPVPALQPIRSRGHAAGTAGAAHRG